MPGVDLDQHHASNQKLLSRIKAGGIFAGGGRIPHDFDVTAREAHGNTPSFFYTEPIRFNVMCSPH